MAVSTMPDIAARLARFDPAASQRQALDDAAGRIAEAVRTVLSQRPGGEHQMPWLRSGELRDSIAHSADENRAVIGSTSAVARYQEEGTKSDPPRPFLAPVAARLEDSVRAEIAGVIVEAIRSALSDKPRL